MLFNSRWYYRFLPVVKDLNVNLRVMYGYNDFPQRLKANDSRLYFFHTEVHPEQRLSQRSQNAFFICIPFNNLG